MEAWFLEIPDLFLRGNLLSFLSKKFIQISSQESNRHFYFRLFNAMIVAEYMVIEHYIRRCEFFTLSLFFKRREFYVR